MISPVVHIGVHPFAQYSADSKDIYANQELFVEARERILCDRKYEQILFLEKAVIPQLETLLRDDYWNERIFLTKIMRVAGNLDAPEDYDRVTRIETVLTYPDHQKISWKEAADRIQDRFPTPQYHFWGAELHLNKDTNEIMSGCLPFIYNRLQLPGTIEQAACYILKRIPNEGVPLFSIL